MAQLCSDRLISFLIQRLGLEVSVIGMDVHKAALQVTDLLWAQLWASCCWRKMQKYPAFSLEKYTILVGSESYCETENQQRIKY